MKILYLSLPCFFDTDAKIISDISTYADLTFVLILPESSPIDISNVRDHCDIHGIDLVILPVKYRQRDPRSVAQYFWFLYNLKLGKFDVCYIYCNDHPLMSLFSFFFNNEKSIVFIHDVEFHSGSNSRILKFGRAITLFRFKRFQVFSQTQLIEFQNKFPKKDVLAIPLSLKDFGFPKNFETLKLPPNKCTFLFFGKILPYKGLDILIEAMNTLVKRYSDVHLIIAGKCDNWYEYEKMIENNANFSTVIEYIPDEIIPELFSKSTYLVLPYMDATQSGPLMIAYNYNLPIIASDIPAFREFIEEHTTGFFFKRNSVSQLVEVLEHARSLSYEDYDHLKKRMKKFIESRYSIDVIAPKYREMFFSLKKS